MIRLVALGVAAVLALAGCAPSAANENGSASGSDGSFGTPTVAGQVTPDRDGSGFDLSFVVDQRPPSVIVGAVIGSSITAYQRPDESSASLVELANPNAVGGPLVFQLVANETAGAEWVEVLLPIRPNGITGWVKRADLELSSNPFRIEIDIDEHRLEVLKSNEPWMTTSVAIGTGETPTPVGRFYVTELLRPPTDDGPYGPFAFGISGYSETLLNYAGGEGVIGIHGTNEPESIGSDVSHGCIRLPNDQIVLLAGLLPLGTPVLIQP